MLERMLLGWVASLPLFFDPSFKLINIIDLYDEGIKSVTIVRITDLDSKANREQKSDTACHRIREEDKKLVKPK